MLRARLALLAFLSSLAVSTSGCLATHDAGDQSDPALSADELAAESATLALLKTTSKVAYVNVAANASTSLGNALVDAAHRGVDVHVLLHAGAHDPTWLLQQHLE